MPSTPPGAYTDTVYPIRGRVRVRVRVRDRVRFRGRVRIRVRVMVRMRGRVRAERVLPDFVHTSFPTPLQIKA